MNIKDHIPFLGTSNAHDDLIKGLDGILGDGDAIALLPYNDGTFYPKRAYFDKELIGGIGGYETADGDKIVVDGQGEAVRSLFGVDVVLGVDPTEHAAAVDPIKALTAHKNNIGEWIRVDKKGNIVQAGDALEAVGDINVSNQNMVTEYADQNNISFDKALTKLSEQGDVIKIYDIAPPSAVKRVSEDGDIEIESATHIAVDQSKAADLMPTTMDTVELNTALDKARMEEHEEGKLMKYFIYGGIAGVITSGVVGAGMFLMMQVGGGIF